MKFRRLYISKSKYKRASLLFHPCTFVFYTLDFDPFLLFENKLMIILISTPPTNAQGIIHKNEIFKPKDSSEKLTKAAIITLKTVPEKAANVVALRTKIARKNGTKSGAVNKLTVL